MENGVFYELERKNNHTDFAHHCTNDLRKWRNKKRNWNLGKSHFCEKLWGWVMSNKHTQGPWTLETVDTSIGTCHKIGPFPSNGARSETYACVYADNIRKHDYGHSKNGDELLANAHLIAAAPELLDVCRQVRLALFSGADLSELFECRCDEEDSNNKFMCLGHKIENTIKKATGVLWKPKNL